MVYLDDWNDEECVVSIRILPRRACTLVGGGVRAFNLVRYGVPGEFLIPPRLELIHLTPCIPLERLEWLLTICESQKLDLGTPSPEAYVPMLQAN